MKLLAALVCAAAFVYGVHLHLIIHEDWGAGFRALLSRKERRMALFSEGAFYFSFGQQFVDADTPAAGLRGLLADRRTEHPNTIVPLRRFNIAPELLCGAAFRSLRWLLGVLPVVASLL